MSLPPLPRSKNLGNGDNPWHEFIKLAKIFAIQPNLEDQLNRISEGVDALFSCRTRIWLDKSYSELIRDEGLANIAALVSDPTLSMEQAIHENQSTSDTQANSNFKGQGSIIALPLKNMNEVFGAIQLEKTNRISFTLEEIEIIKTIASQLSITLNYWQQSKENITLQRHIAQYTSIEEISQSILSNLDRDSLLNSIISLLHQLYGFSRVNIFTARGEDKAVLKKIGISPDGFESEKFYYYEQDTSPVGWCVAHLDTITINDAGHDSRFLPSTFEKYTQSELVLPLFHGDLFIGVLDLCADSLNAFLPQTVRLLTLLAEKITIAIRNANLYHSEQISRLVTDRLREVVGSISADVSLDEIYMHLLEELEIFLPGDASAIWLMDAASNELEIDQFTSSLKLTAIKCKNISDAELFDHYLQNAAGANELLSNYPWINEVIKLNIPVLRGKNDPREPLGGLLGLDNSYSAIAAPLVINGRQFGAVICVDYRSDQYDEESLTTINTFAQYAAIGIENARLYHAAHDQAWVTTVLFQIAEATQSITNLDELLETIGNILPGLIGVEACSIFLWDQNIEAFFFSTSNGYSAEQVARLNAWDIPPGAVIAFDNLKENRSPVILNADTISEEMSEEIFPDFDFRKDLLILFPLLTQNFLCGAILVDFSSSDLEINSSQEVWDEKYVLIQGAAHQAAIAIENLQLIKSQEEEAYISVALLQVAQAVVSLNQLDEILGTMVRITPILAGIKRCIIYIWDAKDQVFRQSQYFGFSKNELSIMGQVIKASEFPFIEAIQRENQIIYYSLRSEDTPITWNEIAAGNYHMIAGVSTDSDEEISIKLDERSFASRKRLLIGFPLSVKGEILGAMLIEEEDPIKGFPSVHIREKRMEIVKGITQQAAIAIKNELLQQEAIRSERMERELQLAREIQATLLPDKLPEIPGWDIDVRWQPARQVGGDFYDILALDENNIGFVIADVADKGMPAALFMTLIRTLIRSAAKEKLSPAAVLKQVNELLIPDSKQGMFVTVFYGVIHLDSGSVMYANAGHNPPIIKKLDSGGFIELTRTTIALGIFADIDVEERELSLNPGDWILLYTDGVTESFSLQGEIFGKERLVTLLSENNFNSSKDMLDLIIGAVNKHIQGMDLSDDMTMVAIYRKLTQV